MNIKKLEQYMCEHHKDEMLLGLHILQDKMLQEKIQLALIQKGMEIYREKVLYELALDYASK